MSKQSALEKRGIEERNTEIVKNDYQRLTDEYSAANEDAISDPSQQDKPLGKGTKHGGHTYYLPDKNKSTTEMNYSNFDTFNGGGSYDIYGKDNEGGRKRLVNINLYSASNSYGVDSVDTTLNQEDGQFVVK